MARLRSLRNSRPLDAEITLRPEPHLHPSKRGSNKHTRRPPTHRNIAAEIRHKQWLRQQNSFEAARTRNILKLEQGRIRSQDLLFGQSSGRGKL